MSTVTIAPTFAGVPECPTCGRPTVAETVARYHRISVTFCEACNLVVGLDVPLHGHSRGCEAAR